MTSLEGRVSQLFLDFSQLHAWRVDRFWTLKGSSALVQLMLELFIHCRISCSFIRSIWSVSSKTDFFWQTKEAIPEEALLASCSLERCQVYWKSSENLAAKLYQVHAWTCVSRALQQAKCRQLYAGGVAGLYMDPPPHHLPTFLSATLLSLVQCQTSKHRGTSTSQVSGCERKDCEEPMRV